MIDYVRRVVAERAAWRREYCKLLAAATPSVTSHVDHIRARQHGGSNSLDNACYCCWRCNCYKGTNQSAYDPKMDELVRIFHPRTGEWTNHFEFNGAFIIGRSAVGRATMALLQMNGQFRVDLRRETLDELFDEG
jgi:hypothetical protein